MSSSHSTDQVLADYFSDLLGAQPQSLPSEANVVEPTLAPEPAEPAPAPERDFINSDPELERRQKLERLLASARARLEVIEEPAVETALAESVAVEVEEAEQWLSWCDNGRPQWAQERFEVLLFEVAGLKLAVPLIALGQIYRKGEQLTPLFGQADWFMGLLHTPQGEIRTVNTARFVMPERYRDDFADKCEFVITLHGANWGLAVGSVNQPVTLEVDDVKWRGERTKRPWLAGTVKAQMCALIDIPRMAQILEGMDANSSPR